MGTFFRCLHLLFIFFAFIISIPQNFKIVGLKNFGETCYANAVFQLLYRSQDFRTSLDEYLRTNQNRRLAALNKIFLDMDNAESGETVTPNTFAALPEYFDKNSQYDVAELIAKYQEIPHFNWTPFAIKIQKLAHQKPSKLLSVEFDLELFLNVPEIKKPRLSDLLDLHFRISRIRSVSKNLIIRIKRLHKVNGHDEKIITEIPVPENIQLKQDYFVDKQTSSPQYRLDSFIEHCGNCSDGGHYVFYFHENNTGDHYVINDEIVQKISKETFLKRAAQAYLFLYQIIE